MKKKWVFLFILLFPYLSPAQNNLWTYYYSHNHVTAIASKGDYLWIGYDCGLERRNIKTGETTQYFTYNSGLPKSNYVNTLAIDSSGSLWVSTGQLISNELSNGIINGGLVRFGGTNWDNYSDHFKPVNSAFPPDITYMITDRHDMKWLSIYDTYSTGTYIYRFDERRDSIYSYRIDTRKPGSTEYISSRETVASAAFDTSGSIWFVTRYTGAYKFDGKNWERINSENSAIPEDNLTSIAIDRKGTKWIGTKDKGLARLDSSGWKVYNTTNSQLQDDRITALAVDSTDNIWIGTAGSGIARFNGAEWKMFNTGSSSLPDSSITCLTLDSKGNIWAGTLKGGYARFNGSEWISYNTSNSKLKSNEVLAAADSSGNVWAVSSGEIFRIRDTVWTKISTENSGIPKENLINLLQLAVDPKGNKWFISPNSVVKFNDTAWVTFDSTNTEPSIKYFRRAAFDSAGNASFTVNNGLAKYNGNKWIKYPWDVSAPSDPAYVPFIPIAVKADGNVYAGNEGGIWRFDGSKWFETFRGFNGLAGVNDLGIDHKGLLWAAMGIFEGSTRMHGQIAGFQGDSAVYHKYGFYNTVAIDDSDNIWAGSLNGMTRIDRKKDAADTTFNTYNSGVPDNRIRDIFIDKFNRKWIAGAGIAVFSYGEETPVSIKKKEAGIPQTFSLFQNYPNPFNPVTTISYFLPNGSFVSLRVFDVLGREAAVLENSFRPAGNHKVIFNASRLSGGVYIYQIKAGKFRDSKKFILLK